MIPDPVQFGAYDCAYSVAGGAIEHLTNSVFNTQLSAVGDYASGLTALCASAERWRLAYAGVTIYQDGPSLADQGTVVAAQVPTEPSLFTAALPWTIGLGEPTPTALICGGLAGKQIIRYQGTDVPDYTTLVRMPNAYFSQSKFGVYVPLKLSTNHQQWHSLRDCCYDGTGLKTAQQSGEVFVGDPVLNGEENGLVLEWAQPAEGSTGCPPSTFPYYGSESVGVNDANGTIGMEARGCFTTGNLRCMPMNETWAHACFKGMSLSTRLMCYFRFGVEVQCLPTSPYSSYLRLPPVYDREAVDAYFRIARELKDAYPADYNSLGTLWNVIKGVARKVLPIAGQFGPIGQAIQTLGTAVVGSEPTAGISSIRDAPPAAEVERARERRKVVLTTQRRTMPLSRPKRR
jgi:hypothetical protein